MSRKYRQKEWLESKYVDESLQQSEIAEMCGVSQSTISDWMKRHGIETPDHSERASTEIRSVDLGDTELRQQLEYLYCKKGQSTFEIAEKFGVGQSTVHLWMRRFDIKTRTATYDKPPAFTTDSRGYEYIQHSHKGEHWSVPIHKLTLVAEGGLDAVRGKVVHHKNGVKWDNRPSNLEAMTRAKHAREHHERGDLDTTGLEQGWLK